MNAKEEFLRHTKKQLVKCAQLRRGDHIDCDEEGNYIPSPTIDLKMGYTSEDLQNFLKAIDFDYNNGYGGQNLFGCIWYRDYTWSERGEYDGSEWWNYHSCPQIPEELNTHQLNEIDVKFNEIINPQN